MSIIIFIISLAVLILVHEFGHFSVAKLFGIRVDEFGLGFPPKVLSKKWGETTYTLNAIPFGGFVKIFGEDGEEKMSRGVEAIADSRSFAYKPKWIQALVLVAGVSMNLVFAWLLVSLGFMIGLPSPDGASYFGTVTNLHVIVTEVLPNSPAEKAGIVPGDTILSVSSGTVFVQGQNVTPENVSNLIASGKSKIVDVTYVRGKTAPVTKSIEPANLQGSQNKIIGVGMESIGILRLPIHFALLEGARTTWFLIKGTAIGLGTFFWNTLKLKSDLSQVSGPVGIAGTFAQAESLGFVYILSLIALISINLAIINLVPFPALDGGRLLFVGIEAIIHRPIPQKIVRYANSIGFFLLLLLMFAITTHDILKLL